MPSGLIKAAESFARIASDFFPHRAATEKSKLAPESGVAIECSGHEHCAGLKGTGVYRCLRRCGPDFLRNHSQWFCPCGLINILLCEFEYLLLGFLGTKLFDLPCQLR